MASERLVPSFAVSVTHTARRCVVRLLDAPGCDSVRESGDFFSPLFLPAADEPAAVGEDTFAAITCALTAPMPVPPRPGTRGRGVGGGLMNSIGDFRIFRLHGVVTSVAL